MTGDIHSESWPSAVARDGNGNVVASGRATVSYSNLGGIVGTFHPADPHDGVAAYALDVAYLYEQAATDRHLAVTWVSAKTSTSHDRVFELQFQAAGDLKMPLPS